MDDIIIIHYLEY